jgi:hypothetical protein
LCCHLSSGDRPQDCFAASLPATTAAITAQDKTGG